MTNLAPDFHLATEDAAAPVEVVPLKPRASRVPLWLRLLLANPKSRLGILVFSAIVGVALAAPLLAHDSPHEMLGFDARSLPPSAKHPFGTTDQTYDVFAQVVWGARQSLAVGALAALISTAIATTLGLLAAYRGGWIDDVVNLVTNVFLVIPTLPLLIVIAAYLPNRGPEMMVMIVGLTTWAVEARVLRGQALTLRNRDFVLAAKVAGESTWRIVWGEIMPNMVSRIAAAFVFVFYISVLFEAGLEFLGLGDVNRATWGTTMYWAQNNSAVLQGEWWHFVFPGLALAITVAALVLINYGVDEISNPRLRQRKAKRRLRSYVLGRAAGEIA